MILHNDCAGNVRSKQIASLKQVLNLNQQMSNSLSSENNWKILVFDKYGQDIISPIMSVKQLREQGVTLHLLITSDRQSLPDVPAVYFVSPVDENIKLICNDLRSCIYDQYYLNMIYPVPRPMLEELASSAVAGGTHQNVQRIVDQYMNFISLEDDLFMVRRYSIDCPFSFLAVNDPSANAETIDNLVGQVARGLFSVCVTLGVVPIIKTPKNNAAEQVAKRLDQKIRENLCDSKNNLFTQEVIRAGHLNLQRPVLVIADRNMDLSTMLHHTWTYQAMVSDILDMELNRIRIKDKNNRQKEFEFSSDDKLWNNHKGSPFPLVAEAIQDDLDAYRKNEDEIKRLKNNINFESGQENGVSEFVSGGTTTRLSNAVTSLPELIEMKRLIDMHTTIATLLLDNIKERKLDALYELEEKLLNGQDSSIMELVRNIPNAEDALRLILILSCSRNLSQFERNELVQLLEERNIPNEAFLFIQRMRSLTSLGHHATEQHSGAGTKTVSMFSKLLSHSSRFVMEGVKNLVPKKHDLPLTKMVEKLTDIRSTVPGYSSSYDPDEFSVFDPKLMQSSLKDWRPLQPASDVIVFVVGGGNYVEYQNIRDYGKNKGLTRITYGCTEIVNPKQFIEQLSRLEQKFR